MAKKLRLKGKGHEFSDAARLLNYYQLWLDNLYPRAKFADGLQLVEKAGHSKRMQTMRKEWIDEGKHGYARENHNAVVAEEANASNDADSARPESNGEATAPQPLADQPIFGNRPESDDLFFPDTGKKAGGDDDDDVIPEDDELDALLAEEDLSLTSRPKPVEPESEGEDDLDAFLAEQETKSRDQNRKPSTVTVSDEDDDLDALLAEHDASRQGEEGAKRRDEGAGDEDDLDALLADHGPRAVDATDANVPSSSPFPVIDDDENSELIT